MQSATDWVASLSPWPRDGFGLERMTTLLDRIGNPQRAYGAVHVVGTKGKSTAARTVSALLRAEGYGSAAYTSPHVAGWEERLDTDAAGFERAVERVRAAAVELAATQFEILTAAAFADFAERGVDVAVVEAGLGGRLDATNVLGAKVVLLTNVGLEHTEVLGETREAIAREKLAVAAPESTVVLPDREYAALVEGREIRVGGARAAAEAWLGRPTDAQVEVALAGRLELREGEVRDGAHTPEAVDWLLARLPEPHDYTVVASILGDKDADGILQRLGRAGRTLVATRSSSGRALSPAAVADRGRRSFANVVEIDDPRLALAHARALGKPVLVTGSLYLLADLSKED
jgi:dihydrofolate synthase / folylpolyglutamate synthase